MNDLIKVNSENQNQAIDRCMQILNERREALASKDKILLGREIIFRMTFGWRDSAESFSPEQKEKKKFRETGPRRLKMREIFQNDS